MVHQNQKVVGRIYIMACPMLASSHIQDLRLDVSVSILRAYFSSSIIVETQNSCEIALWEIGKAVLSSENCICIFLSFVFLKFLHHFIFFKKVY